MTTWMEMEGSVKQNKPGKRQILGGLVPMWIQRNKTVEQTKPKNKS